MTEAIIHGFEIVEVENGERKGSVRSEGEGNRALGCLLEAATVQDLSQRVLVDSTTLYVASLKGSTYVRREFPHGHRLDQEPVSPQGKSLHDPVLFSGTRKHDTGEERAALLAPLH
jgi:hypothetical protein